MKLAAVLGMALLFGLVVFWDHQRNESSPQKPLQEPQLTLDSYRRPLPDFKWQSSDGHTLGLKNLKTKVTLISFWADWCWPCRQEMPYLVQMKSELPKEQFQVWLINLDQTGKAREKAKAYWQEAQFSSPFRAVDKDSIVAVIPVEQLPYHVVVGPKGEIVWEGMGAYHWQASQFQEAFKPLLVDATDE